MITHVVLVQPSPETHLSEIEKLLERIKQLKSIIPGIVDVQVGKNMHVDDQGYGYGFVMRFSSADHLKAYLLHPLHQAIDTEINNISSHVIVFDLSQ